MKITTTTRISINHDEKYICEMFRNMLTVWQDKAEEVNNCSIDVSDFIDAIENCLDAMEELDTYINEEVETEW